jgi:glutamate carboxypeptidase
VIVRRIREAAASARTESIDLLRDLVDVNSHSTNPEGINEVSDLTLMMMPSLLERQCTTDANGVHHYILSNDVTGGELILLLGHIDTVYPPDHECGFFEYKDGRIFGPGTADMKGGITVMVQALRIIDELGYLEKIPLKCLLNGDEETGSPFSSEMVRHLGKEATWGVVFECGGLGGEVVTRRRGVLRYDLEVKGQARHAGVKEGPKASALLEMAHKILELEDLNDPEKGVSVNVGTVEGGQANNIVPDHARAGFEFRFWDTEGETATVSRIKEISARTAIPGCNVSLTQTQRRPCMVPVSGAEELVSIVKSAALELGQTVNTEIRGGASDGNLLSEMGVPVIDGLGPVGDLDHSPDEYIIEKSLYERIELTALLLCRLAGIKE